LICDPGTASWIGILSPRNKLLLALPVVAAFVIVLAYFQLFTNTVIIVVIFVLWVAVSLRNRRKFNRQEPKG
jgi:Flp pilus assembly protein TadB